MLQSIAVSTYVPASVGILLAVICWRWGRTLKTTTKTNESTSKTKYKNDGDDENTKIKSVQL